MIDFLKNSLIILVGLLSSNIGFGMATWKYPTADFVITLDSEFPDAQYSEDIQSEIKELGEADRNQFFDTLVNEYRENQKIRKFSVPQSIAEQIFETNPSSIAAVSGGIIADHLKEEVWERFNAKYSASTDGEKHIEALESLLSAGIATTFLTTQNIVRIGVISWAFIQYIVSMDELQAFYKKHVSDPLVIAIARNYHQVFEFLKSQSLHGYSDWVNSLYLALYNTITSDAFSILFNAAIVTGAVTYFNFLLKEGRQVKDFDQLELLEVISVAVEPVDSFSQNLTADSDNQDIKSLIGQSDSIQTVLRNSVDVCISKLREKFGKRERVYQLLIKGFCDPSLSFVRDLKELSRKSAKVRRVLSNENGGRMADFQKVRRVSPASVIRALIPGFGYQSRLKNRLWFAKVENVSPHVVVMDWMGDPSSFLRYLKQTFTVKTKEVFTSFQSSAQLKSTPRRRFGIFPRRSQ